MIAGSNYDEDTSNQNDKPSTLPYPFPYLSVLSLLLQPSENPMHHPPIRYQQSKERESPPGLERGWLQQYSLTVLLIHQSIRCIKRLLILLNLPLITSSLMNPLVQTSNHSPKNSGRDMHASRTYGKSPSNQEVGHSHCAFGI